MVVWTAGVVTRLHIMIIWDKVLVYMCLRSELMIMMFFFFLIFFYFFFFQAEDGIRDELVTGVRRVLFRSSTFDLEKF